MLTKRQKEILDFVKSFINEKGYAPSIDEIQEEFDLSSTATVHQHINALQKKGYINKTPNEARAIEIAKRKRSTTQVPLAGVIAAGEPIEAVENAEPVTVPLEMMPDAHNNDYYVLEVEGNSMIEEGIKDGDLVLIKEQDTAKPGETVVALLDNKNATLKKYYPQEKQIKLEPANEKLEPIYTKNCKIQGKVVGVIRKF